MKTKKILLLRFIKAQIILFGILTLFFNCNKDIIQEETNNIENTQVIITSSDSIFNTKTNNAVEILKTQLSTKLKTYRTHLNFLRLSEN
tara:strand:+ start:266 stop:532 length:267 start_codon:yes stop_codon:yes gene_type:complete